MRAICSLATGRHLEMLAHAEPTYRAYAERWGWQVEVSRELLSDRPPSWSKVILLQRLLADYEYVWWVDADALFVSMQRDILAEVDDSADVWVAHHSQHRDEKAVVPNAGVMLVRSTDFARDLLRAMWDMTEYIDDGWWENAALLDLLGYSLDFPYPILRQTTWQAGMGRLDLCWNNVPGYCETSSPMINHWARGGQVDFDSRLAALRADAARSFA